MRPCRGRPWRQPRAGPSPGSPPAPAGLEWARDEPWLAGCSGGAPGELGPSSGSGRLGRPLRARARSPSPGTRARSGAPAELLLAAFSRPPPASLGRRGRSSFFPFPGVSVALGVV